MACRRRRTAPRLRLIQVDGSVLPHLLPNAGRHYARPDPETPQPFPWRSLCRSPSCPDGRSQVKPARPATTPSAPQAGSPGAANCRNHSRWAGSVRQGQCVRQPPHIGHSWQSARSGKLIAGDGLPGSEARRSRCRSQSPHGLPRIPPHGNSGSYDAPYDTGRPIVTPRPRGPHAPQCPCRPGGLEAPRGSRRRGDTSRPRGSPGRRPCGRCTLPAPAGPLTGKGG
jgi:hypothetical protein